MLPMEPVRVTVVSSSDMCTVGMRNVCSAAVMARTHASMRLPPCARQYTSMYKYQWNCGMGILMHDVIVIV